MPSLLFSRSVFFFFLFLSLTETMIRSAVPTVSMISELIGLKDGDLSVKARISVSSEGNHFKMEC